MNPIVPNADEKGVILLHTQVQLSSEKEFTMLMKAKYGIAHRIVCFFHKSYLIFYRFVSNIEATVHIIVGI